MQYNNSASLLLGCAARPALRLLYARHQNAAYTAKPTRPPLQSTSIGVQCEPWPVPLTFTKPWYPTPIIGSCSHTSQATRRKCARSTKLASCVSNLDKNGLWYIHTAPPPTRTKAATTAKGPT